MGKGRSIYWLTLIFVNALSATSFALESPEMDIEGPRSNDRVDKLLPIFQVVRFPNDPCIGGSNNGTCYTAAQNRTLRNREECSSRGGTNDGSCASGFGVCCTFTFGCGTMSSENCTYFTLSSGAVVAGGCSHIVCPCDNNICSIRLDFSSFVLTGPTTTSTCVAERINGQVAALAGGGKQSAEAGQCLTDSFTISNQNNVPIICGTNTGQHIYFDSSRNCNSLDFIIGQAAVGTTVATRTWNLKITQVRCDDRNKPPEGCDQYFYGATSGTLMTFNNQASSGKHLADQHQAICIRKEQGFCRVCFSADSANDVSFGSTAAQAAIGHVGSGCCGYTLVGVSASNMGGYDCIMIPGAIDAADAIKPPSQCGNIVGLITAEGALAAVGQKTVCTRTVPFRINFLTDAFEWVETTESDNVDQEGFKIRYFLTSC